MRSKLFLIIICICATGSLFGQELLKVHNKPTYINGINIPWASFGSDVGSHPEWGSLFDSIWFDNAFEEISKHGINTARLWLHADGRTSPEFDESGYVSGLDSSLLDELEIILDLADKHGLGLILSLWSFDMNIDRSDRAGPFAGTHSDLFTNSLKRRSYITNALLPIVRRVDKHCGLTAWEIMNEPEWLLKGRLFIAEEQPEKVSLKDLQIFVSELAGAIHTSSTKPVGIASNTIASYLNDKAKPFSDEAMKTNCPEGQNCSLDYYSFSYYDWMDILGLNPILYDASKLCCDKPMIISEFSAQHPFLRHTMQEYFMRGYGGFCSWAYNEEAEKADQRLALKAGLEFNGAKRSLTKAWPCHLPYIENSTDLIIDQLYPNPANEQFRLVLISEATSRLVVELYSMDGRQALNRNTFVSPGLVDMTVDVSMLEEGAYVLAIESGALIVRKKLLIIH